MTQSRHAEIGRNDVDGEVARGRKYYEKLAWTDAYQALSRADQAAPLEAADLELLATSAYLIGRDDDICRRLNAPMRPTWI